YGPETLGIIFKPAKWQDKKGLPGSTYHYAVPTNIYQRMMAAKDIDAYFNNTIKAHPEQYPFMKVETENPTYAAGASATPQANQTASAQSAGKIEMTTDNPVTSLAVIDTLENSALFASGGVTDAQLAAGREWYLANAPKGIETEEKRTALKRFARPLQKLRTGIEARAKEFTGETKRKLAAIDTEKRRLVQIVGGIEDEVLRPLTEWEREEEARKVRLAGIVKSLGEHVVNAIYPNIASLEETIAELEAFDVSTMQEYKVGAESAIAASLRVLKPELERRREADANAFELAELRRKQAERDEQDRIAEQKRRDDERIAEAAEKLAAQRIAELTPLPVVTAPAKGFGSPAAVQAAQEYTTAEQRQKIMDEAADALMGLVLTRTEAMRVVSAIADGEIAHITISY
ncbi:MAG: hypothetical protein WCA89_10600, partial [Terracidiphilus sp.]